MKKTNIIVIGAGLAGLTLARLLEKENIECTILEARDRPGGRIFTSRTEGEAPVEMGATWLGSQHRYLMKLMAELNLEKIEQQMGRYVHFEPISTSPPQLVELPENREPTYRIAGGSDQLISALSGSLRNSTIQLNQKVKTVQFKGDTVTLITETDRYECDIVVSTLPPKLLVDLIAFEPSLPQNLQSIAASTQTWMAESIKVALTYEYPFWRDGKNSGTVMSNTGTGK
jgi:monoamine oxidase